MATLRGFSKRIKAIADGVEKNSDSTVRKVVITVASAVSLATPVDTGRARANWRTNLGGPIRATREPFAKGKDGSTGAQNVAGVTAEAQQVTASYKGGSGAEVWISNNLPYIGVLNDGSSKQAPRLFVQKAIMAGARAVAGARLVK